MRFLTLVTLLLRLALASEILHKPFQPTGNGDRLLSFQDAISSKFLPQYHEIEWAKGSDQDGQLYSLFHGSLIKYRVGTAEAKAVVAKNDTPPLMKRCWVSQDEESVLFKIESTSKNASSSLHNYTIFNIQSRGHVPLVEDQDGDIQHAEFSPRGNNTVFIRNNNIFIRYSNGSHHQITHDGGLDMLNGVSDWLYKEEVLGTSLALWFSPDGKFLAFLSFNETGVDTFTIPIYKGDEETGEFEMHYPEAGTKNPRVNFNLFDVETRALRTISMHDLVDTEDQIIGEVAWVTEGHAAVMVRVFNRDQTMAWHVLVNPVSGERSVVRRRDGRDGWLDNTMTMTYVGPLTDTSSPTEYYVDLSDETGWMHMHLYAVDDSVPPVQLTSGNWEVSKIIHVDTLRGVIYYIANTRHSTEQHIYSISIKSGQVTSLVDDTVPGVWSASFSSGGGFYALTYRGPDVPYQDIRKTLTGQVVDIWTDNKHVVDAIEGYSLPNITYFELQHPDGSTLNVRQQVPPNFNPAKKYPVLFYPYGAPGSQRVIKDFHVPRLDAFISSDPSLQFIVYKVDNRGTGGKGRRFRSLIRNKMGTLDVQDQLWAAGKLVKENSFLDPNHVGIHGWSYGGFVAAKAIETNTGVFTFGISVAGPTDWKFYDTIYTERYMGTPESNPSGYAEAKVHDARGFKNLRGTFAIAHGTADDNVHYQPMTTALTSFLSSNGVPRDKFRMQSFPGGDHYLASREMKLAASGFLLSCLEEELGRDATSQES
ncbi:hypothetical protein CDD81_2227 [Ophiocordyceps australis]|uniref:Probable dipeptidyl-aminopeptidase B n=1 Tax=Ophiocordyceps australis TaxID=1399860 RepID=A0A2C5XX77_9HYPO|nr:hypothetical protein CDD81_2227 [Ophiocordyceps australis]